MGNMVMFCVSPARIREIVTDCGFVPNRRTNWVSTAGEYKMTWFSGYVPRLNNLNYVGACGAKLLGIGTRSIYIMKAYYTRELSNVVFVCDAA